MHRLGLLLFLATASAAAQADRGELRLIVTDSSGSAVRTPVEITSAANGYNQILRTDNAGTLDLRNLTFGVYTVRIAPQAFAPYKANVSIQSELPATEHIRLQLAAVQTSINVNASTLLDPNAASTPMQLGPHTIDQRLTSLPGRSLQDLIVSQPGWLYEGNAVLHPRGAEYQTQFVIDGIPVIDNRSPSLGPELEADNVESMTVYTAGIPAEFGRKLGGVVEVQTQHQTGPGIHGQLQLFGGTYSTVGAAGRLQQVWTRTTAALSASAAHTDHYLNPVVPQNYTNTGTTDDLSVSLDRDLTAADRLRLSVRHEVSRYLVPDELIQQLAGQIQNAGNAETLGTARFEHLISPNSLFSLSVMARDNANDLDSNTNPTPIAAFQHNYFREAYLNGSYSLHHAAHDIKLGFESDNVLLHENFSYTITNPEFFDSATPTALAFSASRPELDQSVFVEDSIHLHSWNLNIGLRWDHYQLLLNQHAVSPRLSLSRYFRKSSVLLHASFDRVFITPSFENILISSSPQASALDYPFLHLPVQPSRGNYYEAGLSKLLLQHVRLDADLYRRNLRNFADDDQLLNTGVSYPIAFRRAAIYGAEGKLAIDRLGPFSGFASYSYMVGSVWLPVTGGVFLGDEAEAAAEDPRGHFPNSQDQRNTVFTRLQYQPQHRIWMAAGAAFGSGLPFEYQGDPATALAEYGPAVIGRINFDRGRVRPNLSLNASLHLSLLDRDQRTLSLQADAKNLTDRLNLIDFGGLFSGNAIAPGRTVMLRLAAKF